MFKTLLKQIGDYKRDAVLTPIFVILEVIMEVIIPMMMAAIIDYRLTGQSIKTVCLLGAAMIVMAGLALFFGVESGRTASSASSGFAMNLRQAMYERIQTFSFSNIDKFSTAGLVTRMTTDVMNVQQAFQMSIRICVRAPIMLVSTVANIGGTLFMRNLIDDYILPFVNQVQPDLTPLLRALFVMAAVYYIGVFCTWAYNFIMIYVSQGMLKTVRNDLFRHMERLPIRYFDTKSHGDIMSIYTNDTDTLRQVISQSIPQMLSAVITIVGVFFSMLVLSRPLTLITVVMVICMVFATKTISSKSGYYFVKQQTDVGNLNGYIEEMMEGQKVVKVFCHEDACIQDFKCLNGKLRDSANNANRYASILMPVLGNLGYVSYAVIAMVGACLSIFGGHMTLGTLASFLQFSRSFNQPISQLSQQLNSIIMAIAGAEEDFWTIG